MLRVGVTGGIGSGKSYVCHILEGWGFPVYHTDTQAKRLMVEDQELKEALTRLMGEEAYDAAGQLNKTVVASYLFRSAQHAAQVNQLVHPCVKNDFRRWCRHQSADLVFLECAILFESRFDDVVDVTVCVAAPEPLRIQRAVRRDHTTPAKIEERMCHQWPQLIVAERSDHVILNDGRSDLDSQLCQLLATLRSSVSC